LGREQGFSEETAEEKQRWKIKVKVTLEQATKAQVYLCSSFNLGAILRVGGRHAPAPLQIKVRGRATNTTSKVVSNFSKHLIEHQHSFGSIQNTMQILRLHNKGTHLRTWEIKIILP
jgi:hypothetical protein